MQVHLSIDDNLLKELKEFKKKQHQTMQELFVNAVRQMLTYERNEKESLSHGLKFIDLFAGIGGMRIAFQNAGASCIYANEWNKYCQKSYFDNFGILPEGDITKVDVSRIPDHDILVAGFPCQPFSIAGIAKKNSLGKATGFEDKTQGTLFFDVCRFLKHKRPKAFLLENVKNIISHDGGKTFKIILEPTSISKNF